MSERRRTPRHTLRSDLRVLVGPERTEVRGRLVDLSPNGMLIRAANMELEEDGLLQVHLATADGTPGATAIGRVVRSDDRGIAFCFDALWSSDEAKLSSPDRWRSGDDSLHVFIDTPRWWQIWGPPVTPPPRSI
jgi:hypothetical protein